MQGKRESTLAVSGENQTISQGLKVKAFDTRLTYDSRSINLTKKIKVESHHSLESKFLAYF